MKELKLQQLRGGKNIAEWIQVKPHYISMFANGFKYYEYKGYIYVKKTLKMFDIGYTHEELIGLIPK